MIDECLVEGKWYDRVNARGIYTFETKYNWQASEFQKLILQVGDVNE
jgi:hypothetical protein